MKRKKEKSKDRKGMFWSMFFGKLPGRKESSRMESEEWEDEPDYPRANPYLHKLRGILEQILPRYQMSYREFRPLLIDTDMPPESLLDEDQVEVALEQISRDLNFLQIVTDRPAYFAEYIERMYEDSGLIVQLCPKGQEFPPDINAILDMEQKGVCSLKYVKEDILYIPVYKREWCMVKNMENLDISIPIGYNTVIVKGV